jgi:hypothetical protein
MYVLQGEIARLRAAPNGGSSDVVLLAASAGHDPAAKQVDFEGFETVSTYSID